MGGLMQSLAPTTVSDATVQMIARVTIAGSAVRVRLEKTFGPGPLEIQTRVDESWDKWELPGVACFWKEKRPVVAEPN